MVVIHVAIVSQRLSLRNGAARVPTFDLFHRPNMVIGRHCQFVVVVVTVS